MPAKPRHGRITTAAPNLRWATDGAKVWTADEGRLWLFTTIEHRKAECPGHPPTTQSERRGVLPLHLRQVHRQRWPRSAHLLAAVAGDSLVVTHPGTAPHPDVTVAVLKFDGPVSVDGGELPSDLASSGPLADPGETPH